MPERKDAETNPPTDEQMAADTARFRELLLAEKARILRAAQRTLTEDMTLDQDDLADEVDLATADYNQALAFRMRGRERHLLDKIDEAMERLDEGEYFWCADCGESIGVRRLLARPVTTLCIRCKEREEHRERGFAR